MYTKFGNGIVYLLSEAELGALSKGRAELGKKYLKKISSPLCTLCDGEASIVFQRAIVFVFHFLCVSVARNSEFLRRRRQKIVP